jgi:hypothetical protein
VSENALEPKCERDNIWLMVIRKYAAAVLALAAPFTLLFSSLAFAASPGTHSADAREREATAQKFVEHSLHVWQQRLNLSGWNLKVELLHAGDLEPKTLGNIHWDRNTKTATIAVLSSYDYTLPLHEMLDDMEFTIVHELVHLNLCSLPKSAASERNEEYAVNQIAHALIDLEKHSTQAAD